jgi:hypothetical protein
VSKRGRQETAPHARGLLLITLVLHVFPAQYSNYALHTTFLLIAMASKYFLKKRTKRVKLKDQRTDDANNIIPIKDPREDDIIIPYVFFSGFRG